MIVVTLTNCPPRLRGDLSKWLQEINTGVYVGLLNQRVREELWKRICDNLPRGQATMVYSANNEQRMEFRVHNTTWTPVDFDGLTLMLRPVSASPEETPRSAPSSAAVGQMIRRKRAAQVSAEKKVGYVVVDIETTGLDHAKDEILELGAIRVIDHEIAESFSALICTKAEVPSEISALTGITREMAHKDGIDPETALTRFWDFVGKSPIVGHNLDFDLAFITKASAAFGIAVPRVSCSDTLMLARRRVTDVPNHRLETLAEYFGVGLTDRHRALADCITTFQIYEKLNEL